MVLVTGASGKTGHVILNALIKKGMHIRALAFRNTQAAGLRELGAEDVMIGNMMDPGFVRKAAQGIQAVYHICPNVHPHEVEIGRNVITAAQSGGCNHFVYHSVLHPQTEAMPHHWQKLRVEERLLGSGLPFTILQPAPYMQNIHVHLKSITELGVYPVPYAAETKISMVDLADVAEVAALVLSEPHHKGAVYPLCGIEALSQTEVARQMSAVFGRPVQIQVVTIDQWKKRAQENGLDDYRVETLAKMFTYYEQHHFVGNGNVLKWLLGREPAGFTDFLKRGG